MRPRILACSILLAGLLPVGCSRFQQARGGGQVEAKVNGEDISSAELLATLKESPAATAALEKLVLKKLLEQEAKKQGVAPSSSDLEELRSEWLKRGADSRAIPFLERDAKVGLLMKALILKKLPADESQKFYSLFAADLMEYEVWHIFVTTAEEASGVSKELASGRAFEVVAEQYSKDLATKKSKGYMGWFVPFQLRQLGEATESTVTSLKVAEVSRPVRIGPGYHIFRVSGVRKSFDELKRSVESRLVASEQNAFLRELYGKAKIESTTRIKPTTPDAERGTATPSIVGDGERGTATPGLTVDPEERGTPAPGGFEQPGERGTPAVTLPDSGRSGQEVELPQSNRTPTP